ncbi:MAG: hypothetical protein NVS2B8_20830 [Vulcanimicrobiaceae bacterium]
MRLVKFGSDNMANELAQMSEREIDELAFGAVEVDADGKILRYNAAEAEISGRDVNDMIGRNFFSDVAPCTQGPNFEGKFRDGVAAKKLDVQFTYLFDYKMTATQVRVRMQDATTPGSYWIFVKRV